jgi:DNA-binding beta-propeller fold protein YncE
MSRFDFLQFVFAAIVVAPFNTVADAGLPQPGGRTDDYLLVADWGRDTVRRYNGSTGDFVDVFVPKHSGGLNQPWGTLFGPHDGNLYVSSGEFAGPGHIKAVLRYDGMTGDFVDEFSESGRLMSPRGIIFGQDGNLYVADHTSAGGRVVRFDGTTGAYIDDFVSIGSGGLHIPLGILFGPNGTDPNMLDLYVVSFGTKSVLRYDGTTGAFLEEFVTSGSGGLDGPAALTFAPSGELLVSDFYSADPAVFRYQGPSGPDPGAFIEQFVPPGSGGLRIPASLIFGPDGNGDDHVDLYVTSADVPGFNGKKASVKRYDGVTGTFIDTFIMQSSGRLDDPLGMTFTRTDPVTLNYLGVSATNMTAHSVPEPATFALYLLACSVVPAMNIRFRKRHAAANTVNEGRISCDI